VKVGEIYESNNYGKVVVLEVQSSKDVTVKFISTGYVLKTISRSVVFGMLKDKLLPSVYSTGFVGEGQYSYTKHKIAYTTWKSMLRRCYDTKFLSRYPTYQGCSVEKHWHNFQNFAEWFYENHIEGYELDKDLKVFDNKIYSKNTCWFIPNYVNSLIKKY